MSDEPRLRDLTYVGEIYDGDKLLTGGGTLLVINPNRPPRILVVNPDGSESLEPLTIQPPLEDERR